MARGYFYRTANTPKRDYEISVKVGYRSEPAGHWDPGDYDEEWDEDSLTAGGCDVARGSWRYKVLVNFLDAHGKDGKLEAYGD